MCTTWIQSQFFAVGAPFCSIRLVLEMLLAVLKKQTDGKRAHTALGHSSCYRA